MNTLKKENLKKNCLNCGVTIYAPCITRFDRKKFCSRVCTSKYSSKGERNGMYGKKHSEKTKKLLIEHMKNRDVSYLNSDENIHKALLHSGPTVLEKRLEDWINEAGLEYVYVGNGAILIERHCPDFVNYNGKKIFIELGQNEKNMYKSYEIFKNFGFETLLINNCRVRNGHKDYVINQIKKFEGDYIAKRV